MVTSQVLKKKMLKAEEIAFMMAGKRNGSICMAVWLQNKF